MNAAEAPIPFRTLGLSRRQFLQAAVTAPAATALARLPGQSADASSRTLIDTNVSLGRWPLRRSPLEETAAWVAKLRANGVTQAWAGSFDALLHKDIAVVNARLVQIACSLEDERTQHPRLQVPPVDLTPLLDLLGKTAAARVQLLNALRTWRSKPVLDLAAQGARFEIATLEGVQGITNALAQMPGDRLCFGSHAPFYYFESAKLKLQESVLSHAQMNALCADNARRLLTPA